MNSKHFFTFLLLVTVLSGNTLYAQKYKILVFSKTGGYHHLSIPSGIAAIQKLGADHKFGVDLTTDSTQFTADNLKKYAAVVFLSTSGNIMAEEGKRAFEQYIQAGGGFVGIHAASTTSYDWPWYGKLVGGYFTDHPEQVVATMHIVNRKSLATKHLPATWTKKDEWYNFRDLNPDNKVLIELDETTYKGGTNGAHHPLAWYHDFDGGRSFYTGLGHEADAYSDPMFLKHLLGGIQYAIGQKPMEK